MLDGTHCLETQKVISAKVPAAFVWMPPDNVPGVGRGKTHLRAADSQELPASCYTIEASR